MGFPNNPSNDQIRTHSDGRRWKYKASKGVWRIEPKTNELTADGDGSNLTGVNATTLGGIDSKGFLKKDWNSNWTRLGYGDSGTAYWHKLTTITVTGYWNDYNANVKWTSRYNYGDLNIRVHSDGDTVPDVKDATVVFKGVTDAHSINYFKYTVSGSTVEVWVNTPGWQEFDYIEQVSVQSSDNCTRTWYTDSTTTQQTTDPGGTVFTDNTPLAFNGDGSALTGIASPYTPCKSYVESYTSTRTFNNGNASVLKLFTTRTIQAGKDVDMYLRVPARDNTTSWGGLYVNINVRVNGGTWYNLGNSGYDGGVMANSSNDIATSHHHKILDFIANAGVSASSSYTVQFEVTCRSYNGTTTVNGSHDINKTGSNLNSRGSPVSWARNQNYTTLILKEIDR